MTYEIAKTKSGSVITLPTEWGDLQVKSANGCVIIYRKPWEPVPFLRLHSACMFAESLGGSDCDCKLQLDAALKHVGVAGGAVVYLAQEGRGIGLAGKIEAIALQQQRGLNTAAAYKELGYDADPRSYEQAATLMKEIGFPERIRLATNNPAKVRALEAMGFEVVERFMPVFDAPPAVAAYLREKQEHLGHYG